MILCIVAKNEFRKQPASEQMVTVLHFLDGDVWATDPNTMVQMIRPVYNYAQGTILAHTLMPGDRVWVNVEKQVAEGTYYRNSESSEAN
jgi:hypothetical protein